MFVNASCLLVSPFPAEICACKCPQPLDVEAEAIVFSINSRAGTCAVCVVSLVFQMRKSRAYERTMARKMRSSINLSKWCISRLRFTFPVSASYTACNISTP